MTSSLLRLQLNIRPSLFNWLCVSEGLRPQMTQLFLDSIFLVGGVTTPLLISPQVPLLLPLEPPRVFSSIALLPFRAPGGRFELGMSCRMIREC